MITLKRAFERFTSRRKRASWRWPRKVRFGLRIVSRHCWDTGSASDGVTTANGLRVL